MESSPNNGNPNVELAFGLGVMILIIVYRAVTDYYDEIIIGTIRVVSVLLIIALVAGTTYFIWKDWTRKKEGEQHERDRAIRNAQEAREKRKEQKDKREEFKEVQRKHQQFLRELAEKKENERRMHDLLDEPFHILDGFLTGEDVAYLREHKYEQHDFVPLGEQRRQSFLIRPQHPESVEHTFVVQSVAKLLEGRVENIKTYPAMSADIIFWYKGKDYAFEIETPLGLRQKQRRLRVKANWNDYEYIDRWWFIVTRSAYKRSFKRFGKVLTRNEVIPFLNKRFPLRPRVSGPPSKYIVQRRRSAKVCKSRRQKRKHTR
jgi:hypothetical protein